MPQLVIGAMRASDPNRIWRHRDPAVQELDGQLRELAARDGVAYISLLELECHSYPCAATGSPWPEIFDDEHFNETGSAIVAREIRRLHTDFGG